MAIEVNFNQYCPSIGTCFQVNCVLLELGYIHGIQLLRNTKTKEYCLHIERKEIKTNE